MSALVVVAAVELPTPMLDVEEQVLAEIGARVLDLRRRPLAEIRPELAAADAILTEGAERLDAETIDGLDRCTVISVYAIGTDGIDIEAATQRGIVVTHVPDYCTTEVAEHTVALLLAAWRKLARAERIARSGDWAIGELRPIRRFAGTTVGLLGFGRVAQAVAARMQALGTTVLATDPAIEPARAAGVGVRLVQLRDLLRSSDVLSVHVPLTEATRRLLGRDELALLRPGAVLVNTGRAGVVDAGALLEALERGHLAAAALDVLPVEPAPPSDPLLRLDNVVCTPHMAYYSEEALQTLRHSTARNALLVLRGETPGAVVNPDALQRRVAQPDA